MAGLLERHAQVLANGLQEVNRRTTEGLLQVNDNWNCETQESAIKEEKLKQEIYMVENEILILEEEEKKLKSTNENSNYDAIDLIKKELETQSLQNFLQLNKSAKFVEGTANTNLESKHENKALPVSIESESIAQLNKMTNILSQLTGIIFLEHQRINTSNNLALWELKGKTTTGGLPFSAQMEIDDDHVSSLQITVPKAVEGELEAVLDSAQVNKDLPLFTNLYSQFAELFDARQKLFHEFKDKFSQYVRIDPDGLSLMIEPENSGIEGRLIWKADFTMTGFIPVISMELIPIKELNREDVHLVNDSQKHFTRMVQTHGLYKAVEMFVKIILNK